VDSATIDGLVVCFAGGREKLRTRENKVGELQVVARFVARRTSWLVPGGTEAVGREAIEEERVGATAAA
jgi:hypothetical protein